MSGQMEDSMLADGKTVSSMEKEHTDKQMVRKDKDTGKMEKESSGLMNDVSNFAHSMVIITLILSYYQFLSK